MVARIMVALGGRAAEELVFNRLESGAYSDFSTATEIARAMVCSYGMSKALGPLVYKQEMGEHSYSEETAKKIDEEMRSIMEHAYTHVVQLLKDNRDKLILWHRRFLRKKHSMLGRFISC